MKLISITLSLLIISCGKNYETKHITQRKYSLDIPNINAEICEYTIDSCQYLGSITKYSQENYLTHKGNCTNPIHKK